MDSRLRGNDVRERVNARRNIFLSGIKKILQSHIQEQHPVLVGSNPE